MKLMGSCFAFLALCAGSSNAQAITGFALFGASSGVVWHNLHKIELPSPSGWS
jgi:UDP-N-acetylmuramyl pentapeptide phosphotransferase/UDP-N-acetylglucosamine-1-phosphate transferase